MSRRIALFRTTILLGLAWVGLVRRPQPRVHARASDTHGPPRAAPADQLPDRANGGSPGVPGGRHTDRALGSGPITRAKRRALLD